MVERLLSSSSDFNYVLEQRQLNFYIVKYPTLYVFRSQLCKKNVVLYIVGFLNF